MFEITRTIEKAELKEGQLFNTARDIYQHIDRVFNKKFYFSVIQTKEDFWKSLENDDFYKERKDQMKPNFINCTPHPCTLQDKDGNVYQIESDPVAKAALTAKMEEVIREDQGIEGIEFVSSKPIGTKEGFEYLQNIPGNTLVLSSLITAQAYGFPCVGMVPVEGFERVPPDQKRMRDWKFNIY